LDPAVLVCRSAGVAAIFSHPPNLISSLKTRTGTDVIVNKETTRVHTGTRETLFETEVLN